MGGPDRFAILKKFVDTNIVIRDLLLEALQQDRDFQTAVMELYLLKTYQATHNLQNLESGHCLRNDGSDTSAWITFDFMTKSVTAVDTNSPSSPKAGGGGGLSKKNSFSFTDLASMSQSVPVESAAASPSSDLIRKPKKGLRRGILATVEASSDLPRLFPLISAKVRFYECVTM